jgi:hypothetical protein
MGSKIMKLIIDTETNEMIERPLTKEELEQEKLDLKIAAELKAKEEALKLAKEASIAKLTALGLGISDLIALGLIAPEAVLITQ